MKRTADINEILKPLKDTPFQAYLSNAVQVADILDWILSQVGVAEIWQTSFSISEEFLRRLFFICKIIQFVFQFQLKSLLQMPNDVYTLPATFCRSLLQYLTVLTPQPYESDLSARKSPLSASSP